jgi:hypothetical protein
MTNDFLDDQPEYSRRVRPPAKMTLLFVLLALIVTILVAEGRLNLREVVQSPLDNAWLLWLSVAFLVNSCLAAGTNVIVGPASTDDYKADLERYLLELKLAPVETVERRRKIHEIEQLIFDNKVFLYDGQLVRSSGWAVFFGFWTHLGLLVALLVLNWQWTLILLLVTFVLFYLPFFRKAGLVLAKPLHRRLCEGVDY